MTSDTLPTYSDVRSAFRIEDLAAELSVGLGDDLNACHECCDRHVGSNRVALYLEKKDGLSERCTFAELQQLSARFANLLRELGIGQGDVVAGLLPRTVELVVAALGTWRAGAIYQTLFTAFGASAIQYRLAGSGARLIITDAANRPKLDDVAGVPRVVTVTDPAGRHVGAGDLDFWREIGRQDQTFTPVTCSPDDPFLLLFTSGTVGSAKGVAVPLGGLLSLLSYMHFGIGLRGDDSYWNVADPGWAYGLYYALVGPLLMGHATTFYDGPFAVESTYRVIEKYGITNIAAAPTAYRLLMAAGPEAARSVKGQLRVANSAGEPLNPEVVRWFEENVGCSIYDQYGQTETGMVVCNYHTMTHPRRPGAMGLPVPGYRVVVLDAHGREVQPGETGQLAIDRAASPLLFFRGYWGQGPRDIGIERYHLTGDMAHLDHDGTLSFVGRADDLITSAGYRIGPFEVESCLIEHPAVAESAVIGVPDAERTERVKAFVVLRPTATPMPQLATELQQHVKRRLGGYACPREIEFVTALPKTPSGKVQRFVLRNQERARTSVQQ